MSFCLDVQMMVKSPDPVNWTVPLDTGKTFTVTHNIPEGKIVLFISANTLNPIIAFFTLQKLHASG